MTRDPRDRTGTPVRRYNSAKISPRRSRSALPSGTWAGYSFDGVQIGLWQRSAAEAREVIVIHKDIDKYNRAQAPADRAICKLLAEQIDRKLPEAENKIWHAIPVWFLDGNPIVGYGKLKDCVRLLFWSGQSFKEKGLAKEGSFKAADVRYTAADQVDTKKLGRWLAEARDTQWDYKNLVRRKGRLERLT